MHAEENNLDPLVGFADLTDSLDAVKQWHGDIRNDDVGLELARGDQQRPSIFRKTYNLVARFQDTT